MDSFLSIIIICVISSISSSTSIQLFSEEGIIHRLGEGFYHIKSDIPREYFINFKARQSMGVNVLGGIYIYLSHGLAWNMYRVLHAFECNSDIISRVNGEVISRGEAECNLAISE